MAERAGDVGLHVLARLHRVLPRRDRHPPEHLEALGWPAAREAGAGRFELAGMEADDREAAVADAPGELEHAGPARAQEDGDRRLPAAVAEAALAAGPERAHLGNGALQLREPRRPGADRAHRARAESETERRAPAGELLEGHECARRHRDVPRDRVRDRRAEADPPASLGRGAEEDVELAPEHRRVAHPDAAESGRLGELDA